MARNKEGRPEWFRIWRRNRQQIDLEYVTLESRGVVFTNLLRLFDTGEDELLPMEPVERVLFDGLRVNIRDALSEYEQRSETNRGNGLKGGRPPKPRETEGSQENQMGFEEPKKPEVRIEKKEVRIEKKEEKRAFFAKAFVPPTIDEIASYCSERGYHVDAQAFFLAYSGSGWMVGTEPMRNWHSMVDAWERRAKDGGSARNINHGAADQAPDIPGITRL